MVALRSVDLAVERGEVHGLVGANGAGKSTLVKILSGTLAPDGGEVRFEGRQVTIPNPVAARELGIETVYQDLALAPELDPAANLFLGRELVRPGLLGRLGFLPGETIEEMMRQTEARVAAVAECDPEACGSGGVPAGNANEVDATGATGCGNAAQDTGASNCDPASRRSKQGDGQNGGGVIQSHVW